ncbi:CHAT domain-containing protein, partial [Dactylonectria macrodidyma]
MDHETQPTTASLDQLIQAAELLLESNHHYLEFALQRRDVGTPGSEDIETLEDAIRLARQAIDLVPGAHDRFIYYSTLASGLELRFLFTRSTADIEEAVSFRRLELDASLDDVQHQADHLYHLSDALVQRYSTQYALADIEEAIELDRQAIEIAPDSPDRAMYFNHLARCLGDRYTRTRASRDLEEAVVAGKAAIEVAPDDAARARYLIDASNQFGVKSPRTSDEINESIALAKQAYDMTSNNLDRFNSSLALANRLNERFIQSGNLDDIEQAILLAQELLDSGKYHPEQSDCHHTLAVLLFNRYIMTGRAADLERGILLAQQSVDEMTGGKHATGYLNTLAFGYSIHFSRNMSEKHGESGIKVARRALEATPENHPRWADALSSYAEHLIDRFRSTRALSDLDEAILCTKKAADTVSESHPEWPLRLSSVATQLHMRYLATDKTVDLEEGIRLGRIAISATLQHDPMLAERFHILAKITHSQYLKTKAVIDLDESIRLVKEAVDATLQDQANWPNFLTDLANRLHDKYRITGQISELDESISLFEKAVDATTNGSPHLASLWASLASSLFDRHKRKHSTQDLTDALAHCQSAVRHVHSIAVYRLLAGRLLVILYLDSRSLDLDQLYEDSKLAVSLVPRLISRSLESSDKQLLLANAVNMASEAAVVALEAGKGPLEALYLLERGRGHPALADRFVHLQNELSVPTSQDSNLFLYQGRESPWSARFDRRYGAGREFDSLVEEICGLQGFEDFLGSPRASDIKDAAKYGPIALINVSELRCDAILIEKDQVRALALPSLTLWNIENKSKGDSLASPDTLEWLWDTVACPVLRALGFDKPFDDVQRPHMWWIPVGALSRFPLHAAGYHVRKTSDTVLDRVMSSYSSSIRAIVHGRRRHTQPSAPAQALLIAMPQTTGHTPLLHTTEEVSQVHSICHSMRLEPVQPSRRKQEVALHIQKCTLFHFAGHGHTSPSNPSHSQLFLEDWRENPFRVSDLLEMNLHKQSPFLAYLSACGTGRVKDKDFLDESIHLISAFQLAGFRHVIGTLWEVDDACSVDMAKITYQGIKDGGITDESVCWGLHNASRTLRDRWIQGMQQKGPAVRQVHPDHHRTKSAAGPVE